MEKCLGCKYRKLFRKAIAILKKCKNCHYHLTYEKALYYIEELALAKKGLHQFVADVYNKRKKKHPVWEHIDMDDDKDK